jgi:predicted transcriptional regulator
MRKTHAQLLVQERTDREIEELLRELYVEKRYSDQEIATALGDTVTRAAVQQWRRRFGIERPPIEPLVA